MGMSSKIEANKYISDQDRKNEVNLVDNQNALRVIAKVNEAAPF